MDHNTAQGQAAAEAEESFRLLFTSTYSALVAYARRRTFDHAEADDVVADVYATAWRRRDDMRLDDPGGEPAALPWLYGIAANVIRNSRRAGSRRLRLVERLEAQPQPGSADLSGVAGRPGGSGGGVRDALERLSFDDQEVLRLIAWEGLTHAEAAAALGCSTNAVGIRIHRARSRLQAELVADSSGAGSAASSPAPADGTESRTTEPERTDKPTPTTDKTQRRGGAPS